MPRTMGPEAPVSAPPDADNQMGFSSHTSNCSSSHSVGEKTRRRKLEERRRRTREGESIDTQERTSKCAFMLENRAIQVLLLLLSLCPRSRRRRRSLRRTTAVYVCVTDCQICQTGIQLLLRFPSSDPRARNVKCNRRSFTGGWAAGCAQLLQSIHFCAFTLLSLLSVCYFILWHSLFKSSQSGMCGTGGYMRHQD